MEKKRKRGVFYVLWRILLTILATLLCLLATAVGLVGVVLRGPSPSAASLFCRTVHETSALRWIPDLFLSPEQLSALLAVEEETENSAAAPGVSLVHLDARKTAETPAARAEEPELQLLDIASGNCRGKLLIVRDPKRVILGTIDPIGRGSGRLLTDLVETYDGVAGVNASGFEDGMGLGNGGTPTGMVIRDGELVWGEATSQYSVVGLDGDGLLIVGRMSAKEALDLGMRWGVSFITHDGVASSLIINGEIQTKNLTGGVNPRTAIGQREDGALLLLVLDGRSITTLGATLENVCDIMLSYGAVTVGNLDGGSSSLMVYDGEIVNTCSSITGPRLIPTAFIVLKEDGHEN